MELLELMKHRRSIRKYEDRQISQEDLDKILEAGLFAPNASGAQRCKIVAIQNADLIEKLGRLNASCLNRAFLKGAHVSDDQPSIVDDPNIKSGFYGAPTICVMFGLKDFVYSVPDAFCCAENIVLEAADLGISSCIIARAEETFENEFGQQLMKEWNIPENQTARCVVLLGYCRGDYPKEKPRKPARCLVVK